MTVNELIKRLEEIRDGAENHGNVEVKVYFQNKGTARDFDHVGLYGHQNSKSVWLSDLGDD